MIKNIAKKISNYAGIAALSLAAIGCVPSDLAVEKVRPMAGGGIQVSRPVVKVKNIPEYIRNVPIHPDDDYAKGNEGPIGDGISVWPMVEIPLKAGVSLETKSGASLDIYGKLSLPLGFIVNRNERNYTDDVGSDNRGEGAALTYYDAAYGPLFIPGIYADVYIPFKEFNDKDIGAIVGAGYRKYDLNINTGWDRYDACEHRRQYNVGSIEEKSLYAGVRFIDAQGKRKTFLDIVLGVNFVDVEERKGVEVEKHNPSWMIGITGGIKF